MEGTAQDRCEQVMAELRAMAKPENLAGMARYGIKTDARSGTEHRGPAPDRPRTAQRPRAGSGALGDRRARGAPPGRLHRRPAAGRRGADGGVGRGSSTRGTCATRSARACSTGPRLPGTRRSSGAAARRSSSSGPGSCSWRRWRCTTRPRSDERYRAFLPLIAREAGDERNFVKKAVNWALRQIGKRSAALNAAAVAAAGEIELQGSRSARWIARDALRELTSEKVRRRLSRAG